MLMLSLSHVPLPRVEVTSNWCLWTHIRCLEGLDLPWYSSKDYSTCIKPWMQRTIWKTTNADKGNPSGEDVSLVAWSFF